MSLVNSIKSVSLLIVGAVLGAGVFLYGSSCGGTLFCNEPVQNRVPVVEKLDAGITTKEVSTTFILPDVGVIDALLEKPAKKIPKSVEIKLPLAVTSGGYVEDFNLLVNTGNQLEVQLRDRLPFALYEVQEAAIRGDLQLLLGLFDTALEENERAIVLNAEFLKYVISLEGVVSTEISDPDVGNASRTMLAQAKVMSAATTAFTNHVTLITQPKPPSVEDFEKIGDLAVTLNDSIQNFAESVQGVYEAIKKSTL